MAGLTPIRVPVAACCLLGALWFSACSPDPPPPAGPPTTGTTAPASPVPSAAGPSTRGSAPSTEASSTPTPVPTTSDQPVPKVERSGAPRPTVSAKPARVDGPVRYADGIVLRVRAVEFDKETRKGPGNFPGREYAVLTLQIANRSRADLSMATVVVTVLDKADRPVVPVSTEEAEVSDFAGTLRSGATVSARYAFAVPRSSRSKVTVVIDFDGAHTSAVFRGALG